MKKVPSFDSLERWIRFGVWIGVPGVLFFGEYSYVAIWVFPEIGVLQNGWYIMEKPIKMDDFGVPLFSGNIHMCPCFFCCGREIVKRNETLQVSDTACGAITTFSGEFVYKQFWEAGLHSLKRTGHPLKIGRVAKGTFILK